MVRRCSKMHEDLIVTTPASFHRTRIRLDSPPPPRTLIHRTRQEAGSLPKRYCVPLPEGLPCLQNWMGSRAREIQESLGTELRCFGKRKTSSRLLDPETPEKGVSASPNSGCELGILYGVVFGLRASSHF